jgi:hypothetical protein
LKRLFALPGNNSKIYGGLIAIVILVFAAFKLHALYLPYFWDELGVYSRACLYMAEHGLSLLPSSLPPVWSRGHPLLFQFIYATAFVVFGKSVIVGHSVSLIISCALIFLVYRELVSLYNRLIGFCVALLLCCQPLFMAQSTLVLPEMLLGLFSFLALSAYYKQHMFWFALYASLAIMVKESAIVIPFTIWVYEMAIRFGNRSAGERFTFRNFVFTAFPLIVFAFFLLVQKLQNGWFFFPLHEQSLNFEPTAVLNGLKKCFDFLFKSQGRNYWWIVYVLGLSTALIKNKHNLSRSFAALSFIYVAVFLAFTSANFYMDRYLLTVLPALALLLVVSLFMLSQKPVWMIAATAPLSILCLQQNDAGKFNYDADMGFEHHLRVQQKLVNKICSLATDGSEVFAAFPVYYALTEENTGFNACTYLKNCPESFKESKYLVYTAESGGIPAAPPNYRRLYYVKESFAEGVIYENLK